MLKFTWNIVMGFSDLFWEQKFTEFFCYIFGYLLCCLLMEFFSFLNFSSWKRSLKISWIVKLVLKMDLDYWIFSKKFKIKLHITRPIENSRKYFKNHELHTKKIFQIKISLNFMLRVRYLKILKIQKCLQKSKSDFLISFQIAIENQFVGN